MRDRCRSEKRIGEVMAHEPKTFIRVYGAGHLALGLIISQLLQWIDRALPRAAP
jgi:hypothetical protein